MEERWRWCCLDFGLLACNGPLSGPNGAPLLAVVAVDGKRRTGERAMCGGAGVRAQLHAVVVVDDDDDFVEQRGSMHDLNPKKLGPARYFNAILYTCAT